MNDSKTESILICSRQQLDMIGFDSIKGTRGDKSSEPEIVAVIPIYCETC